MRFNPEQEALFYSPGAQMFGNAVLVSHAIVRQWDRENPATLSPAAIGRLRARLPDTLLVTDDMQMQGLQKALGTGAASLQSLKAGMDMLCIGNNLFDQEREMAGDCRRHRAAASRRNAGSRGHPTIDRAGATAEGAPELARDEIRLGRDEGPFSSRAPGSAAQPECGEPAPLTVHGVVFAILSRAAGSQAGGAIQPDRAVPIPAGPGRRRQKFFCHPLKPNRGFPILFVATAKVASGRPMGPAETGTGRVRCRS